MGKDSRKPPYTRRPEDWFTKISTLSDGELSAIDSAIATALAAVDINTTAPIVGGGNLSGDLTLSLSGTKAQFNTSCSDGDFLFVGDVVGYTNEEAQDAVGGILVDSASIDFTYDDGANTITAIVKDGSITFAKLLDATGASVLVGRGAGSGGGDFQEITLDPSLTMTGTTLSVTPGGGSYTDEEAQDAIAAAFAAGTHTGITITYTDGSNSFDLASTITQYTDEMARDAIGTALVSGKGVTITVNDGADTITVAIASGSSFPGSPASGDLFRRSDMNYMEFLYNGTRWISTQVFFVFPRPDLALPLTATQDIRAHNPWCGIADIWLETFTYFAINSATTASNYFTAQAKTWDGAASTNRGSSSSMQNDTQNSRVHHSVTIDEVVSSSVEDLGATLTETGTASIHISTAFRYRVIAT